MPRFAIIETIEVAPRMDEFPVNGAQIPLGGSAKGSAAGTLRSPIDIPSH
jgi:hypothetical protein